MNFRISIFAPFFLLNMSASAEIITCSDLGLFWGDCRVATTALSAETRTTRRFAIQYRFHCPGHGVNIGFESGNAFTKIQSSTDVQEQVIEGQSLIVTDKDPSATLKSTFDSACNLEIIDIKISPSENSKKLLEAMKEEGAIIVGATEVLLFLSDSLSSVSRMEEQCNLESVSYQRDQLRRILGKFDINVHPAPMRFLLSAGLDLLDQMALTTKGSDLLRAKGSLRELHQGMLKEIVNQQIELLNRITELQLRATEIFVDAGKGDDPESLTFLSQLEQARLLLQSRT